MSDSAMAVLIVLLVIVSYTSPIWILIGVAMISRAMRRAHNRELDSREADVGRRVLVMGHEELPQGWRAEQGTLVQGSAVYGVDHFTRFLAVWRKLVGGEVRSVTPILTQARREAVLRMLEAADKMGATAVVNVRVDTAVITTRTNERQNFSMTEIFAYGTAIKARA